MCKVDAHKTKSVVEAALLCRIVFERVTSSFWKQLANFELTSALEAQLEECDHRFSSAVNFRFQSFFGHPHMSMGDVTN